MIFDNDRQDDPAATKKVVKPLRPLAFNKCAAPEEKLNQVAWENAARLKHREHAQDNAGLMFTAIREYYPVEEIRELLTSNIDRNARDDNGYTFTHVAAAMGNLNALAVLINAGLDMYATINDMTPLVLGLKGFGMEAAAVMLAKADPDLSRHTVNGETLMHMAAKRYGCDRVLEVLLERGMDPAAKDGEGHTPLYHALKERHPTVFLLCNAGGYRAKDRPMLEEAIAAQGKTHGFDYDWNLLLDYAARKKPSELKKLLPQSGPQKPVELGEEAQALFREVRSHGSDFRFDKYYSETKALGWRDHEGRTPFMAGVESKTGSDLWAVRALAWKSPTNVKDHAGRTALHYAVQHVNNPMGSAVDALISNGADVNAQDKFGRTPLMTVMRGGDHLGRLMAAGANPHIADNLGLTAMDYGKLYKTKYCSGQLAEEMKKQGWEEGTPEWTPYRHRKPKGFAP
jgi:ankyrin repeat protein